MISHSKKFIFVHIPRTGGTVLSSGLGRYGVVLQGEQSFDSPYFKHASAMDIRRKMGEAFDGYFKFSIVRNPWDWVVSNYAFNRGLHRCYVVGTRYSVASRVPEWARDMTFEAWLRWWLDELNPGELSMIADGAGKLMVDEVYRFEDVGDDFLPIRRRLRVDFDRRPVDNRAVRASPDFRDYFNEKTRSWVAYHFREEIARFGYSFEGSGAAAADGMV